MYNVLNRLKIRMGSRVGRVDQREQMFGMNDIGGERKSLPSKDRVMLFKTQFQVPRLRIL